MLMADERAGSLPPEERRRVLAGLLRERAAKPRTYPLSSAQRRVWLAEKLRADVPFTSVVNAVRLAGALDVPALAASLREIVRRHQILRTLFDEVQGEPVQRVAAAPALPLPVVDLAALPLARRERELIDRVEAEARRPFDLAGEIPLRCLLLRLDAGEHALLLDIHHIACDGWSLHVLTGELAALYAAGVRSLAAVRSALPPLPLQYADYAVWERERLRGAEMAGHLAFWRERLDGCPVLALPLDHPRPRQRSFRGAACGLALPPAVAQAVRELARREAATVAMVLLAAFQALLGRSTGQDDVAVASPAANRVRPELERLIGTFSNIVVVRSLPGGDPGPAGFRALLGRVRSAVLAAHAHQELSFDLLVEELRPERDPSRHPLVQVMLNFRQAPAGAVELPGVRMERLEFATGGARFDLELNLWEEDGGLRGGLIYGTDLFLATTAARLVEHFGRLLAAALAAPERPVAGLPLLTAAEAHQLVHEWNDTDAAAPSASIVAQVRAAAARRPEARAVVAGDRGLTFRELVAAADRLAWHLRAAGAGPGVRVALFLDRGADLAVAVLAVLAAGAAFVPLDPRYPRRRLERTLADAGAALLVTRPEAGPPPPAPEARHIDLAAEAAEIAARPPAPLPDPAGAPGDLTYLTDTSGTTGEPKGVAIARRNLDGYAWALGERLGITAEDVYLHTASFAFSSSVRQLLLPLAQGARLVVATADEIADPPALCRLARREAVTVLDLVPSSAHGLVEVLERAPAGEREGLLGEGLRLVVTASEPLPADLPARWRRAFPRSVRWINMLGHTETTGIDAVQPLPEEPLPFATGGGAFAPLGRPLPRRRIHLLDRGFSPVPIGVAGEIAIGGDGVGLGYRGRPERTAEAFCPDPWSTEPGARLYCSGDLGRRLPDGTLAFVGRRDHQVKVRGQRVEIGEIEAELAGCPGVSRTVVTAERVVRAGGGVETRLVAYVVPRAGAQIGAADLRRALGERLPASLLPSAFVLLDALPLTPTGKLDRASLPPPEAAPQPAGREPRTWLEIRLAGFWAEVLEVPRVGVEDDFFALGGHSLLAVFLLARVREAFGVEVGLRAFFARPTVAGMVREVVEQLIAAAGPAELAAVVAEVAGLTDGEVAARLWYDAESGAAQALSGNHDPELRHGSSEP